MAVMILCADVLWFGEIMLFKTSVVLQLMQCRLRVSDVPSQSVVRLAIDNARARMDAVQNHYHCLQTKEESKPKKSWKPKCS